jgi:NADH-quinone oxidoreductase subunit L
MQIAVDPLSVFMMLVVSGVGFLILTYALGYMAGDREERRYHAYKALFVFSMLLLVESGNLLLLLAGWGLVGLSSYLLINFWHERPSAVAAGKKAFIMNAFGDATFVLALFVLVQRTGALDFAGVFAKAPDALGRSTSAATLVALGLLGGAVAKSAQVPLHTWLPDAMEGPTPVSALIHAATMVTAGVYLIARTHTLFELAPAILHLAAILGGVTIVLAGLIAVVQTDIKRVIAYSTMSQIGYMFVGVGLGAFGAGMFHLMTHAFFKALLFMAAGVVIHAIGGEQDIRKMGGLRKLAPLTYVCFLIGSLALVGIPPFAGFFSKDSIIAAAMDHGVYGYVLWVGALVGTFLTGLYTFRMFFVVFHWEASPHVREHFHALGRDVVSRALMWPVLILALLSIVGGWIQFAPFWHPITDWLASVEIEPLVEPSNWHEGVSSALAFALGGAGILVAWWIYLVRRAVPHARPLQTLLERKFYFDELYDWIFYRPGVAFARGFQRFVERPLIAGSVAEVAEGTRDTGGLVARAQTGILRAYALAIAASLAVLTVIYLAAR